MLAAHGSAAGDGTGMVEPPTPDPTTASGDLLPSGAQAAATALDVPAADLSAGVDAKAAIIGGATLSMTSVTL